MSSRLHGGTSSRRPVGMSSRPSVTVPVVIWGRQSKSIEKCTVNSGMTFADVIQSMKLKGVCSALVGHRRIPFKLMACDFKPTETNMVPQCTAETFSGKVSDVVFWMEFMTTHESAIIEMSAGDFTQDMAVTATGLLGEAQEVLKNRRGIIAAMLDMLTEYEIHLFLYNHRVEDCQEAVTNRDTTKSPWNFPERDWFHTDSSSTLWLRLEKTFLRGSKDRFYQYGWTDTPLRDNYTEHVADLFTDMMDKWRERDTNHDPDWLEPSDFRYEDMRRLMWNDMRQRMYFESIIQTLTLIVDFIKANEKQSLKNAALKAHIISLFSLIEEDMAELSNRDAMMKQGRSGILLYRPYFSSISTQTKIRISLQDMRNELELLWIDTSIWDRDISESVKSHIEQKWSELNTLLTIYFDDDASKKRIESVATAGSSEKKPKLKKSNMSELMSAFKQLVTAGGAGWEADELCHIE